MSSATAAPHGLACLTTTAAGCSPSRWTSRHAASASYRLRYESSLPPCCTASSHHDRAPTAPVAGALLVRVLAVAQRSGPARGPGGGWAAARAGRAGSVASSHVTMAASYAAVWAKALRASRRRVAAPSAPAGLQLAEHDARSRPGRPRRRRGRGSWPRRAPWPGRRCRSSRCRAARRTGTGWRPPARSARCRRPPGRPGVPASSRSARIPPCTFGCSVTTRCPRMAGTPVSSATSVTGMPGGGHGLGRAPARHQPPAELVQARRPAPRSPDLSNTDNRAVRAAIAAHPTGTHPRRRVPESGQPPQ